MKDNKKLLVPLVILLMVLSGILGFSLRGLDFTNNKDPKGTTEKEDTTNEQAIKERINHIIEIGTYYSQNGYNLAKNFMDGISSLTKEQKLQMTYIGSREKTQEVMTTPEKYKDNEEFNFIDKIPEDKRKGLRLIELNIKDFETEYKYLFNEEIGEYSASEIIGCPHPFLKDEELGKIYLNHNCGGYIDGSIEFNKEIVKEEKDDNYYYVYVKEGFNQELKEVVWKFDKQGNFVSTTNNG